MDELVTRAKSGDRNAFAHLVERESGRLRAFVACRLCDPETAEDLAQETFIIAHRRLGDFDAAQDFYPWLRGIARNLILNERRKRTREETVRDELFDQIRDAEPSALADSPAIDLLGRCLARLSDRMRKFLQLRYDQGLALADVAGQMGLTEASARVTHLRLLRGLRDCMEQSGAAGGKP
ncbi:MAG TPA: sigma-70 family RNA polymerase sigma factor [Planctomycetota bacterium]|nr:sigma-70 family RNA polymerase sigma factor [Planctomycetota bacterium]